MSYSPPRTAHSMQSKQWCCNKQPIPGGAEEIKGEASSWQASLFVGYITSSLGVCSLLPAWKWSLSKQSLAHTVHMGRRKGTTRVQEGEEGTRRRGGGGEEGSRLSLRQLRPPCPRGQHPPMFLVCVQWLGRCHEHIMGYFCWTFPCSLLLFRYEHTRTDLVGLLLIFSFLFYTTHF